MEAGHRCARLLAPLLTEISLVHIGNGLTISLLNTRLHQRDQVFDVDTCAFCELIQVHILVDVVDSKLLEDSPQVSLIDKLVLFSLLLEKTYSVNE